MLDVIVLGMLGDWLMTLSLIFGGCCSNALTLELLTTQFPPAGTLVTFAQFLLVSIIGLSKHLTVRPPSQSGAEVLECIEKMLWKIYPEKRTLSVALYGVGKRAKEVPLFAENLATRLHQTTILTSNTRIVVVDPQDEKTSQPSAPIGRDMPPKTLELNTILLHCLQNPPPQPKTASSATYDVQVIILEHNSDLYRLNSRLLEPSCIVLEHSETGRFAVHHPNPFKFTLNPLRYRLKPRKIPLSRYLVQVALFLSISLLNNLAFAYQIQMPVHIIFRSGGLVVNMLMGRFIQKNRYTKMQVVSIAVVTLGIGLTTISSILSKPTRSHGPTRGQGLSVSAASSGSAISYLTYATGIAILSTALLLTGFLGLLQDKTFKEYGRENWEEAMFYVHALALPMFSFVGPELISQVRLANASTTITIHSLVTEKDRGAGEHNATSLPLLPPLPYIPLSILSLTIPSFYVPLLANIITQFVCVAGVNRLTSRVNSLTVTLILAVRKAVSLAISVLLLGGSRGNIYLWIGATAVLLGTVGYAVGSQTKGKSKSD